MPNLRARREEHGVYRNKKKVIAAAATCEGKKEKQESNPARDAEGEGRTKTTQCLFGLFVISQIEMLAIKWTFVYEITVIDKPVIS